MRSMPRVSHKTMIGALRDALTELRQRNRWSRESMADEVIRAYRDGGWDVVVGLEFQDTRPGTRDLARAMDTNADRIWRWLDDQTKSTTLLPANLIPALIHVLPADLRLRVLTEVFGDAGVVFSLPTGPAVQCSHAELMAESAKESGEGLAAFALLAEQGDLDALRRAEVEIVEAVAAMQKSLDFVRTRLSSG